MQAKANDEILRPSLCGDVRDYDDRDDDRDDEDEDAEEEEWEEETFIEEDRRISTSA